MIRKLIGIFVCMLMISSALVGVSATSTQEKTLTPQKGTVTITIPMNGLEIEKTTKGTVVSLDNYGRLLIPGTPNLPSKIYSIAIPPGATVNDVTFNIGKTVILPGIYRLIPNPPAQPLSKIVQAVSDQQHNEYIQNLHVVYGQNTPYPSSVGEIIGTGGYRKYNLVDVRITPVSYQPLTGILTYYPDITVAVHYTIPEGFSQNDIIKDNLPQTENTAKEIILNYDQAQNWYSQNAPMRSQYDYVIITTDALSSSIDSLVDWEQAKGRSVNVVTTSWIASNYDGYDLSVKMRAFLRDKYPSEEWGIQNVCLIGDVGDVPMRTTAQDCETDYYYAELSLPDSQSWDANGNHQYGENSDPIDFEAEVNVGRIPWSEPATVQSICEKTVAYEQNSDDAFKKNIMFLGAFFWPDTDNAVLMETIASQSWMTDWTMTRMYEDAQSPYPCDYDLSYNNVKTVWSAGTYAFVDWAGHGSPDAAYEYYPSQPFADEETCLALNDNFPSIVFADSCSNSDTDYLNIGQAMLKQGAIGFLGSNKVAYGCPGWTGPMSGSSQSLDYFFASCCTSGNYTQGEAHQYALRMMYVNSLWTAGTYYEMFEWGSYFGNPDLTMGPVTTSDPPVTPPTPLGPTHGCLNIPYTYTTSTTDPNGDQIYFQFNWGDGTASEWLGPYTSGATAFSAHTWTTLGTFPVKVKARDDNGATSSWSVPLSVEIVNNDPPETPTITGIQEGTPGSTYMYVVQTTDMNGDNVFYWVDWGDNTTSSWLGPFESGAQTTATHSWSDQGTYQVRVKAKDALGDESDWGTLQVVMPLVQVLPQRPANLLTLLSEQLQ